MFEKRNSSSNRCPLACNNVLVAMLLAGLALPNDHNAQWHSMATKNPQCANFKHKTIPCTHALAILRSELSPLAVMYVSHITHQDALVFGCVSCQEEKD